MFRLTILIVLLTAGMIVSGCASTGSSSPRSANPPDYRNTVTGETFYAAENKEFMQVYAECRQKAAKAMKNESKYAYGKYVEICVSRQGYEKIYAREFRKPNTLSY